MAEPYAVGDVVYAQFPAPVKFCPVVVLSRGEINAVRENIVVGLVTETIRRIPLEVPVGKAEGLPNEGVVSLGDSHTIPRSIMGPIRGPLSAAKVALIQAGLSLLFKLEESSESI
jgi:mRNA-degrading endonuclease toxin of MazEF toxin-antitoxin module